ncbi:nuclear transport factor 2 family protein [Marinomonas fungiae]|uniref:Predicted SnoaL-like aldol condensation-catalyzing enzyme n=1 Tax=Marinomonas fungiae TaxID=1137284 RepID=A0A0K6ISA0_9GAMM|nr:nuclear transport factor 2 family protein [Marinomonas fungiae]CUB05959.1 Predicted SnoaL-like aldol condensation-catalyzing enzyme [Marinomonas fungiae]
MKRTAALLLTLGALTLPMAYAQIPVTPAPNQQVLLESDNPQLKDNKKLVYDFWREVFEGGHLDKADQYLSEDYIQHNPNVPTGRDGFVNFFAQYSQPKPIRDEISGPLVSIVAERDMVILSFVREHQDPNEAGKTYTTTWFDMFRIENGKIAEHWDPAVR